MKYILYFALLVIALTIQTTLFGLLTVRNVTPDLLLVAIVFISLKEGQVTGVIIGFTVGLAEDLATAGMLGLAAFGKTMVGFVAGLFYGSKAGFGLRFLGLVLLLCAAVQEVATATIASFSPDQNLWTTLFRYGIPRLVYTATLGFLMFVFIPKKTWQSGLPEWFEERW